MNDLRPLLLSREEFNAHMYTMAVQVLRGTEEYEAAYMAQLMASAVRNFKMTETDYQQQYPAQRLFYTEFKENFAALQPRESLPEPSQQKIQRLTAGWLINNNQRDYIEPRKVPLKVLEIGARVERDDNLLQAVDLIRTVSRADIDYLGLEAAGSIPPQDRPYMRKMAKNPNPQYQLL